MSRVAIYIRVSTEDQAEKWSLQAQERILTELARSRGWEYDIFRDVGSGTSIQQRPALQELLSSLPHYDAILVVDLDRLARPTDLMEYALLKATLKRAGVKIITPNQEFSFEDEQDNFIADLLTLIARWERQMILKRSLRGIVEKLRKGERWGVFQHPYGYRYENGKYEIVEEEAKVVRWIFQLAHRYGVIRIAEMLNEAGIPSPRGKRWYGSSVRRILLNPLYAGRPAVGRGRPFGSRKTDYPNPFSNGNMEDWIWVEREVPAIVSFEEWVEVGKKITNRRTAEERVYIYLLSGILRCPVCGEVMQGCGLVRNRRYGYYACRCRREANGYRRHIPAPKVEWVAEEVFEKLKGSREVLEAIRKEWEKMQPVMPSPSEEKLLRRLQTLEEAKQKLLDLYLEGHIGKEEWMRKAEELKRKEENIRRQIEVVKNGEVVKKVLNILESIRELKWEDLSRWEQKEFCRLVFEGVYINLAGEVVGYKLYEPFASLIGYQTEH